MVLSGGYDGQIKFRVLRRDEILRLERVRDRKRVKITQYSKMYGKLSL